MKFIMDEQTVIAADLDGTLALSKLPLDAEMAGAISAWLATNRFAIISGAKYEQFHKQVISMLPADSPLLNNLYLFPTNGAACYTFKDGAWTKVYEDSMSHEEAEHVIDAIKNAVAESGIVFPEIFGEQIEFRGTQVTFSGLGQEAPLEKKSRWDPDQKKRRFLVSLMAPHLSDFKIGIAGATSIDVTKKGIDKEYAVNRLKELLEVDNDHVIFFGDALFEGGNDWPATKTGVTCVKVDDPEDTIRKIKELK